MDSTSETICIRSAPLQAVHTLAFMRYSTTLHTECCLLSSIPYRQCQASAWVMGVCVSKSPADATHAPAAGLTLLICGGGNGGHAWAGVAAHRGAKVHIYTPRPEAVEKFHKGGLSITCHYTADGSSTVGQPALVTSDPKAAAAGVDVALVVLPTSFHEDALKAVGPHLAPGTPVGTTEGAWWGRPPLGAGVLDHLTFFGIDTLPFVARLREYGESVDIQSTKDVWVASSPINRKEEICKKLQVLLGSTVHPGSTLLSLLSLDLSLIIHPGLMYAKCKDWDGAPFDTAPLFYHGMDDDIASIMETMDAEAQQIKAALLARYPDLDLSDSVPTLEWLHDAYADTIADKTSFRSSFITNSAYEGLTFPVKDAPDAPGKKVYQFDDRYLTADVPYGLLVVKGVAELMNVEAVVELVGCFGTLSATKPSRVSYTGLRPLDSWRKSQPRACMER
eukprot:TRINITY_DN16613_c0_g1_i2.p1 TRINITY_DN16613_c0_g1~~TRINITY_DN16613_c0_g1_i2.p1  ORF type:complete len:449 (+),score=24.35 TRINITY_DN16613_c0_g1_i2:194-1540(+)